MAEEFYVACNPPLLPRGVSEVIRRVQDADGLLEILFEPHVPWFKCIAIPGFKHQVCSAIQDSLFAIADEEVDTLDVEDPTGADVSIVSPDPRMIPWSIYKEKQRIESLRFADADVFPEPIAEAKYKILWSGLERCQTIDFEGLLVHCNTLLGPRATPRCMEDFRVSMRCEISYNMGRTLLYIGSDESQEAVNQTVEKLDQLVHIWIHMGRVEHSIVLQAEVGLSFAYKWLSHVGFHRSTYLPYDPRNTSKDNSMLMNAAAIRAKHLNSQGHWVPEQKATASSSAELWTPDVGDLIFRRYDYKTTLVKKLAITQTNDIASSVDPVGAIENWRVQVSRLNTPPEESASIPSLLCSSSDGLMNSSSANGGNVPDLIDMFNNCEMVGGYSLASAVQPAITSSIDLLDDIPLGVNSTLQTSVQMASEKGSQEMVNEVEDLMTFDVIIRPTETLLNGPPSGQDDSVTNCLRAQELGVATANSMDSSILDDTVPFGEAEKRKEPHGQASSKMDFLKNPNPAAACIIDAEYYLRDAVKALTLMPGRVCVRLAFGRIFLKQFPESFVDLQQTLGYSLAEISCHLGAFDTNKVGFSPILSAREEDMYRLARITPQGADGWDLIETRVYYDLHCSFGPADTDCAVVEIDPELGISCRSAFAESFALYLHCPKHQWDLKLAGYQHFDLTGEQQRLLQDILGSIQVSKPAKGELRMEFLDRPGNLATVRGVIIRHVLIYRQPELDTHLTITLSRTCNKTDVGGLTANSMVPVTWQTAKSRQLGKSTPNEWVEAYLGSKAVDDLLGADEPETEAENGDACSGSGSGGRNYNEQMAGLAKIAGYGGDMVMHMNSIGRDNNNGQNLDMKDAMARPCLAPRGRGKDGDILEYW